MKDTLQNSDDRQESFGVTLQQELEDAGFSTLSRQTLPEKVAIARVLKLLFDENGYPRPLVSQDIPRS